MTLRKLASPTPTGFFDSGVPPIR